MTEAFAFLVILAIAAFSIRYFIKNGNLSTPSGDASPGGSRRRRQVTPSAVQIVHTMFPNIPEASIAYDLEKTGSIEATTDKILSESYLPAPPLDSPYLTQYPQPVQSSRSNTTSSATASRSAQSSQSKYPDLITRYNLASRLNDPIDLNPRVSDKSTKGKSAAAWSKDQTLRQKSFTERRDEAILRARKTMEMHLEKEKDSCSTAK